MPSVLGYTPFIRLFIHNSFDEINDEGKTVSEPKRGSIIGFLKTAKPPKFVLLNREPLEIFTHKPQPSVFFSTINILFKIAISCILKVISGILR